MTVRQLDDWRAILKEGVRLKRSEDQAKAYIARFELGISFVRQGLRMNRQSFTIKLNEGHVTAIAFVMSGTLYLEKTNDRTV